MIHQQMEIYDGSKVSCQEKKLFTVSGCAGRPASQITDPEGTVTSTASQGRKHGRTDRGFSRSSPHPFITALENRVDCWAALLLEIDDLIGQAVDRCVLSPALSLVPEGAEPAPWLSPVLVLPLLQLLSCSELTEPLAERRTHRLNRELAQRLLLRVSRGAEPPTQVPSLIPVLLFKLGKEKNPVVAHAVLNCLPHLGTHKDRIYPELQRLLGQQDSRVVVGRDAQWEHILARAACLRDICRERPYQHGSDMLALITLTLNQCTRPDMATPAALALQGLRELCQAEVVDIVSTWRSLGPELSCDSRPLVVKGIAELLALVPQLTVKSDEYEARPAPKTPDPEEDEPLEEEEEEEKDLSIPGPSYVKLMALTPVSVLPAFELFLTSLVKQEMSQMPRGVYFSALRGGNLRTDQGKTMAGIPAFMLKSYEKNKQPGLKPGLAGEGPPVCSFHVTSPLRKAHHVHLEEPIRENRRVENRGQAFSLALARDQLADVIKTATKDSPVVQGNSILALSGLAAALAKYESNLPADADGGLRAGPEFVPTASWLAMVVNTLLSISSSSYKPRGQVFPWFLHRSYSGENTASAIARSCASLALSLLVPVLVVWQRDGLGQVLAALQAGLPGVPTADDSQAVQFHSGLALGMVLSSLHHQRLGEASGQKEDLLRSALEALERCSFNPNLEYNTGCVLGLGLVLAALCSSGTTEQHAHVTLTLDRLLSNLQDSSGQGRMLQEVLAYSVACVAVSAFRGGLIDADKAEEVMTTLRTLTEESQQTPGFSLALGLVVHGLSVSGHGKAEDIHPRLLAAWVKILLAEVPRL
ncbi:Focadhesin [Liparis tanakae]|uniref:Focadhesin n=1 Tax=Liparis tanakae TaxID=230148 RepID=A0A4Z2FM61_9TELE|nr:Focadhesin [Liparis tanakae]